MARRRLTPVEPETAKSGAYKKPVSRAKHLGPDLDRKSASLSSAPPVARVAREAAAEAALTEITESLASARAEGRFVVALPLDAIVADHFVRDRMAGDDDEEMAALKASLLEYGQRTPIEVMALSGALEGEGAYALISGWRRLKALGQLHDETGDEAYATVRALVREPVDAAAAYVAMVEENEIRADLSHYERARIVALSVERGAFPTEKVALNTLFRNVSRAKRSKIGSFLKIYHAAGETLHHGPAIGERLGMALGRLVDDGEGEVIRVALDRLEDPDAEAEVAALEAVTRPLPSPAPKPEHPGHEIRPGVYMDAKRSGHRIRITIEGPGVTDKVFDEIRARLLSPKE